MQSSSSDNGNVNNHTPTNGRDLPPSSSLPKTSSSRRVLSSLGIDDLGPLGQNERWSGIQPKRRTQQQQRSRPTSSVRSTSRNALVLHSRGNSSLRSASPSRTRKVNDSVPVYSSGGVGVSVYGLDETTCPTLPSPTASPTHPPQQSLTPMPSKSGSKFASMRELTPHERSIRPSSSSGGSRTRLVKISSPTKSRSRPTLRQQSSFHDDDVAGDTSPVLSGADPATTREAISMMRTSLKRVNTFTTALAKGAHVLDALGIGAPTAEDREQEELSRRKQQIQKEQDFMNRKTQNDQAGLAEMRNLVEMLMHEISRLQDSLATVEKERTRLYSRITNITTELTQSRKHAEDLKAQLHERSHEVKLLKQQLLQQQNSFELAPTTAMPVAVSPDLSSPTDDSKEARKHRALRKALHVAKVAAAIRRFQPRIPRFSIQPTDGMRTIINDGTVTLVLVSVHGIEELYRRDVDATQSGLLALHEVLSAAMSYVTSTSSDSALAAFETTVNREVRTYAFSNPMAACYFGAKVTELLMDQVWPPSLDGYPESQRVAMPEGVDSTERDVLWCGLRCRITIHTGDVRVRFDPLSLLPSFGGNTISTLHALHRATHGGMVLVSRSTYDRIAHNRLWLETSVRMSTHREMFINVVENEPEVKHIEVSEDPLNNATTAAELQHIDVEESIMLMKSMSPVSTTFSAFSGANIRKAKVKTYRYFPISLGDRECDVYQWEAERHTKKMHAKEETHIQHHDKHDDGTDDLSLLTPEEDSSGGSGIWGSPWASLAPISDVTRTFVGVCLEHSERLKSATGGRTSLDIFRNHIETLLVKYEAEMDLVQINFDRVFVPFLSALSAVNFALELQGSLMQVDWPPALSTSIPATRPQTWKGNVMFSGLRCKIGIHQARVGLRRIGNGIPFFEGKEVCVATWIAGLTPGGCTFMTDAVHDAVYDRLRTHCNGPFIEYHSAVSVPSSRIGNRHFFVFLMHPMRYAFGREALRAGLKDTAADRKKIEYVALQQRLVDTMEELYAEDRIVARDQMMQDLWECAYKMLTDGKTLHSAMTRRRRRMLISELEQWRMRGEDLPSHFHLDRDTKGYSPVHTFPLTLSEIASVMDIYTKHFIIPKLPHSDEAVFDLRNLVKQFHCQHRQMCETITDFLQRPTDPLADDKCVISLTRLAAEHAGTTISPRSPMVNQQPQQQQRRRSTVVLLPWDAVTSGAMPDEDALPMLLDPKETDSEKLAALNEYFHPRTASLTPSRRTSRARSTSLRLSPRALTCHRNSSDAHTQMTPSAMILRSCVAHSARLYEKLVTTLRNLSRSATSARLMPDVMNKELEDREQFRPRSITALSPRSARNQMRSDVTSMMTMLKNRSPERRKVS